MPLDCSIERVSFWPRHHRGGDTSIAQVNARRHASRCIAMQPKALAASEEARSSPRSSGYVGTAGLNIDIIENYESSTP
jgi:hypothetical protein